MPLTLIPTSEHSPLQLRLRRLLNRFRSVTILRGGSQTALFFLAGLAIFAALDWRFHLPALVRALGLVVGLAGSALLALTRVVAPLRNERDILAMAGRVERLHPDLNDSLLSAVQ